MKRTRRKKKTAIERAKEWGIDLTLIEENLRLTPTERLQRMISMQRFIERAQEERLKKRKASFPP